MSTLLFAGDLWYNSCATQVVGWCAEARYPARTETHFTAKADPKIVGWSFRCDGIQSAAKADFTALKVADSNSLDDLWLRGNHPVAQAGVTVLKVTGSGLTTGWYGAAPVTTLVHNHTRLACETPRLVLQLNKTPLLRACDTRQRLTDIEGVSPMMAKPHCISFRFDSPTEYVAAGEVSV